MGRNSCFNSYSFVLFFSPHLLLGCFLFLVSDV
jgi:hypothetical protein